MKWKELYSSWELGIPKHRAADERGDLFTMMGAGHLFAVRLFHVVYHDDDSERVGVKEVRRCPEELWVQVKTVEAGAHYTVAVTMKIWTPQLLGPWSPGTQRSSPPPGFRLGTFTVRFGVGEDCLVKTDHGAPLPEGMFEDGDVPDGELQRWEVVSPVE